MKNEWISQRGVEYFPKKNKILPPPRFTYINYILTYTTIISSTLITSIFYLYH